MIKKIEFTWQRTPKENRNLINIVTETSTSCDCDETKDTVDTDATASQS